MKISQLGFTEVLAKRAGITFSEADVIVRSFKSLIYESLASGHTVEFSGFGQFSVSDRAPRLGVNPKTLAKITIPELNTPKFVAGSAFKQAVKLK
jgi:nucleoid DNA-binding protein